MDKVKKLIPLEGMETPTVKIVFKDKKTHQECLTVAIGQIILGQKVINVWVKSDIIEPTKVATMIQEEPKVEISAKYLTLEKELKEILNIYDFGQIFEYLFDNFETLFSE